MPQAQPRATRDDIIADYRRSLGRDPENESVITEWMNDPNHAADIGKSPEAIDYAKHAADHGGTSSGGTTAESTAAAPFDASRALPGWDQAKWNDPNKRGDPKYDLGHILAKYPSTPAGLQQAKAEIEAAGIGTVGPKDTVTFKDGTVADVGKGFSEGGGANNWWFGVQNGQPTTTAAPTTPVNTTPTWTSHTTPISQVGKNGSMGGGGGWGTGGNGIIGGGNVWGPSNAVIYGNGSTGTEGGVRPMPYGSDVVIPGKTGSMGGGGGWGEGLGPYTPESGWPGGYPPGYLGATGAGPGSGSPMPYGNDIGGEDPQGGWTGGATGTSAPSLGTIGDNGLFNTWDIPFVAPNNVTEQNDPGYRFRLDQAQQAIQKSAASKGTLLTGGTLKDLNDYTQNYASGEYGAAYGRALGEYQQAYNVFNQQQGNTFNRLASISGLGQTAAGQLGSTGSQYAANAGGLITGAGNAAAAGTVGGANAWMTGLNNVGNSINGALVNSSIYGGA